MRSTAGGSLARSEAAEEHVAPQGEVVVESRGKQFRLRRSHDETAGERLTVAALDQSAVDQDTVRQLVACLSPSLLRPLFAVSFRESPRLEWLLSPEFSHEFRAALWRLKWAPPTVDAELRPIYARLRALETQVATLVRGLGIGRSARCGRRQRREPARKNRRASYFLARLTDGELVRLRLGSEHRRSHTSSREPAISLPVESLWSTQRDQVYLSLCLALVSALGRHGARLPLVLDEPFARIGRPSPRRHSSDVLERFLPPRTPSAGVHGPARSDGTMRGAGSQRARRCRRCANGSVAEAQHLQRRKLSDDESAAA